LSGRESGRTEPAPHAVMTNPDSLEVVDGVVHENLEGSIPALATPEELRRAMEQAFDYRGDVLITRKDGIKIEGYIFDRRTGKTLEESLVRILPKSGGQKIAVSYADIAALAFTGRDMAAGKSWETWVKNYWTKKAAGEEASLEPEELE
jgi:hypothetical protein